MERAIKLIGKRHKLDDDQNLDRLSSLPDGVISHILSFLPTRTSVQTSVLAKTWRTLWAHVPVLDLERKDAQKTTFYGIVCMVLLRHKAQTLNYFRLNGDGSHMGCRELKTCIITAVERNVQNLHLEGLEVEVPRCVLTCKTLVDLTMNGGDVRIPPTALISLPNLKKLHLLNLKCEVNLITRLLSGTPMLEELIIDGTTCRDPRGCCISSPTLKRLTIMNLLENPDYVAKINTPALRYLKVHDDACEHITISPCTSLVEADISMSSSCVLKFLDSIRHVKCLQLTTSCDKILDGLMPGSIATFGNLTELKLFANWRFLPKFLQSADYLEVLTIFEGKYSKYWMEPIWLGRCACLINSLRIVRIYGFIGKERSFNMVRYILRNALFLERMEIFCQEQEGVGWKEKFDAIQRISLFPRGSVECELAFS